MFGKDDMIERDINIAVLSLTFMKDGWVAPVPNCVKTKDDWVRFSKAMTKQVMNLSNIRIVGAYPTSNITVYHNGQRFIIERISQVSKFRIFVQYEKNISLAIDRSYRAYSQGMLNRYDGVYPSNFKSFIAFKRWLQDGFGAFGYNLFTRELCYYMMAEAFYNACISWNKGFDPTKRRVPPGIVINHELKRLKEKQKLLFKPEDS